MLVLSRKVGESIYVGENITLVVVGVFGDKIRLGLEAPKEVKIVRAEVKERDEAGKKEAVA